MALKKFKIPLCFVPFPRRKLNFLWGSRIVLNLGTEIPPLLDQYDLKLYVGGYSCHLSESSSIGEHEYVTINIR